MKAIVITALIALSFTTGFTCSKQAPVEQPATPPAQEQMTPPADSAMAPADAAAPAPTEAPAAETK